MEVRAVAKFVRVQPRKVRLVAAEVRGKPALSSADVLRFHPSKGAFCLRKVLMSAIANAQENHGASPEQLTIARIMVDEGPHMKRIIARAQGRANRILKKTSHITVVVADDVVLTKPRAEGTKPKPRPKFEAPKPKKAKKAAEAVAEEPAAEASAAEAEAAEGPAAEAEAPVVEPAAEAEAAEAPAAEAEAAEGPAAEAEAAEAPAAEPAAESEEPADTKEDA
jgi:large subunit ribosomal protein L22